MSGNTHEINYNFSTANPHSLCTGQSLCDIYQEGRNSNKILTISHSVER